MSEDNTTIKAHELLDHDQLARVAALYEARTIIATHGPMGTSSVNAIDVVNLAQWIIDGNDPWSTVDVKRDGNDDDGNDDDDVDVTVGVA